MTFPIIHDRVAGARLNHPSRAVLREMFAGHEGPWGEADIKALNAEALAGLHFWAENGQLHVRALSQADTLAETETIS